MVCRDSQTRVIVPIGTSSCISWANKAVIPPAVQLWRLVRHITQFVTKIHYRWSEIYLSGDLGCTQLVAAHTLTSRYENYNQNENGTWRHSDWSNQPRMNGSEFILICTDSRWYGWPGLMYTETARVARYQYYCIQNMTAVFTPMLCIKWVCRGGPLEAGGVNDCNTVLSLLKLLGMFFQHVLWKGGGGGGHMTTG